MVASSLPASIFQSTPPVKAATAQHEVFAELVAISIHAAREGGDGFRLTRATCFRISIHAAREGGDRMVFRSARRHGQFQSTPPVKAATADGGMVCALRVISIHAAREGGDDIQRFAVHRVGISIHAAREGGDLYSNQIASLQGIFQSTPPVKAATEHQETLLQQVGISIHAAREGGDKLESLMREASDAISIHAAREGGDMH